MEGGRGERKFYHPVLFLTAMAGSRGVSREKGREKKRTKGEKLIFKKKKGETNRYFPRVIFQPDLYYYIVGEEYQSEQRKEKKKKRKGGRGEEGRGGRKEEGRERGEFLFYSFLSTIIIIGTRRLRGKKKKK